MHISMLSTRLVKDIDCGSLAVAVITWMSVLMVHDGMLLSGPCLVVLASEYHLVKVNLLSYECMSISVLHATCYSMLQWTQVSTYSTSE